MQTKHRSDSADSILLLDKSVVAQTNYCRQTFYPAVKDPGNPIICPSEPWEGRGPYTWGTRIIWNPQTEQYDFYYIAFRAEDNHYRWGLAISGDGLAWTKPDLGLETFQGKPARNMLTGGPHPEKAVRSVVLDPSPECPPEKRYKAIRFTYDGEFVSYSADGRRWAENPENPVWYVPSDIIHAMWDPQRKRFVVYYKVWEISGEIPDAESPTGFRPLIAYSPFFEHHLQKDGLTEIVGPMIYFHPDSAAEVKDEVILMRSESQGPDDGGGTPLTGAWHSRRVIAWAESDDWQHWRSEQIVLACDDRDRPDANIQYLFVTYHGGYYLGFLTMHDERGNFEQQLAFSRDGIRWSRPWRGNFIGLGVPGEFDSGMVLAPTDPILTDTQMLFYYGGFNTLHYITNDNPWSSAIGRAILRRDGFAAWENLPEEVGIVETQVQIVTQDTLVINADAGNGRLTVEVLDETGDIMDGFDHASCQPLTEDTSRYTNCRAPVQWKSNKSVSIILGRHVRLRFRLENARIFSFTFEPSGK